MVHNRAVLPLGLAAATPRDLVEQTSHACGRDAISAEAPRLRIPTRAAANSDSKRPAVPFSKGYRIRSPAGYYGPIRSHLLDSMFELRQHSIAHGSGQALNRPQLNRKRPIGRTVVTRRRSRSIDP
jgi:hypothetical protein